MDTTPLSVARELKRSVFFLVLFFVVSLLEVGAFFIYDNPIIHWVVKPLILLSLIGYYLSMSSSRSVIFVRALFFCWTGDVLLLFQTDGEMFFILGLLAFLLGHVLYISAYRQMTQSLYSIGADRSSAAFRAQVARPDLARDRVDMGRVLEGQTIHSRATPSATSSHS